MYCRACGAPLEQGARFCRSCGAPAPESEQPILLVQPDIAQTGKKRGGSAGKFWLGLLAGVLCCALAVGIFAIFRTGASENRLEGAGFDSPEEAMEAYLDGLRSGDADKAISSFAIETYAAHFNWDAYTERRAAYLPDSYSPHWFGSDAINRSVRFRDAADVLYTQYRLFALAGTEYDMQEGINLVRLESAGERQAFARAFADAGLLSDMKVEKIMQASEYPDADFQERYAGDANQRNRESLRAECGADALCTVFASVNCGGVQYWFAMETACYDGVWYNLGPNGTGGALLGLPAYGVGTLK